MRLIPAQPIQPVHTALTTLIEPPWLAIARSKIGLNEIRDNAALTAFLKSDGDPLGNPAVLPWCGDFVETCLALALPKEPIKSTTFNNPFWADNWHAFGVDLAVPTPGAVMVFTRDGGGHVAYYLGEDANDFLILGGNQSNSVSIMRLAKNRLRAKEGMRWPATYPRPTTGRNVTTLAGVQLSTNER